ncbi:hypothetical protein [Actinoplanes utahensis]|uniref:Uncharacterized protein n=1 Tax=Actinoplanes utahensis TaxID=1869 RepID=A0A0A6UCQ7_ACTUT|nr:hypothetical protein [Actinoplanes utahensis]KHD73805.1 hypothetical protein MB27_32700 [Actinoplanes utahensis]GIF27827.1 hypothetical protein Aut01nite_08130 [Actinoplanes utahensis]
MGASWWSYHVPYQPDLQAALDGLRERAFAEGDYWWAVPRQNKTSAADFPDRPRTEEELWAEEIVQDSGTHSILDVREIVTVPGRATCGTVHVVDEAEALERVGVARPTREHVAELEPLATERWVGRCAVLHDQAGEPAEIYFWGFSGD